HVIHCALTLILTSNTLHPSLPPYPCSPTLPLLLSYPTRRSSDLVVAAHHLRNLVADRQHRVERGHRLLEDHGDVLAAHTVHRLRSEEHTSELQSLTNLVCRLLLEKKKTSIQN